jgi:photosystem II stability/assembly factor-like uncharacterized protein
VKRISRSFLLIALSGLIAGTATVSNTMAAARFDSNTFGSMRARSIGPANMGGRIAALDALREEDGKLTIYVGAASGGLWKSTNGGTSFDSIFDDHTMSIGAVRIAPSDPEVVWVGTGEGWVRNSVSIGEGVYRTVDGGKNWVHLGLKDTERIVKIVVHPDEADTAWVCAVGHLWDDNESRGVYKTTDAGENWNKVLYIGPGTGCSDLTIDPMEPAILYTSPWNFRRDPWFFRSGGPGSGIWKSTDAGETWVQKTAGLPEGEIGRIALAVAPKRPNVLYATVESENTAMYRSDDLGENWVRTGTSGSVESRPFYFSLLVPDPVDYDRIYKPASQLGVSSDGGKTFSTIAFGTHSDHHALWIDPDNTQHLVLGTDGGLYISYDRGLTFNFKKNLPIAQFYQVSVDNDRPYNVYGGLQDNGTWTAPSASPGGVQNKNWRNIGSGDGFHAYVDRKDPDFVYVEWQGGRIQRMRRSTGETKDIQPLPTGNLEELRFNWNAAMHISRAESGDLFLGAQYLFRTSDRGETWQQISPDLTTDDPSKQQQQESGGLTVDNSTAENHCSIYTISSSPLDDELLWVGTDDGNLQITRDAGKTWKNVIANVPDLPAHTWVTKIDASSFDQGTAFVTFDGHRTGNRATYIYKTTDFGNTWSALATPNLEGYALVVRQDTVNPDLLYLGTEFGLWISIDGGAAWARFDNNLPRVGVRDLAIHPRDHDLVIATHGRGIYIIDDLTPLRALKPEMLGEKLVVLPCRPGVMDIPVGVQEFEGDDVFTGSNPDSSANICYYLGKRHMFGDFIARVLDVEGNTLKELSTGKRRGINRVAWSMRSRPPKTPRASSLVPQMFAFFGPLVPAGNYRFELEKGKTSGEGTVEATIDPRADYTAEELALQDRVVREAYDSVEALAFLVDQVLDLQSQARECKDGEKDGSKTAKLLESLDDRLEDFRKTLVATRKGGFLAGEEQLRERLTNVYGGLNGYEGKPTTTQLDYLKMLQTDLAEAEARFQSLLGDLDPINARLGKGDGTSLQVKTRETWELER